MPTYAYHCQSCKANFEVSQKITDEPLEICKSCQKPSLRRGPGGGIGLAFKGPGFYITDYQKNSPSSEKSSKTECCPCGKNKCSN